MPPKVRSLVAADFALMPPQAPQLSFGMDVCQSIWPHFSTVLRRNPWNYAFVADGELQAMAGVVDGMGWASFREGIDKRVFVPIVRGFNDLLGVYTSLEGSVNAVTLAGHKEGERMVRLLGFDQVQVTDTYTEWRRG